MKQYWVIGNPLKFCLNTPVMNGLFKANNIDAEFHTKEIEPEALPDVIEMLKTGEIAGLLCSRPFKTPSIEFLDQQTERVDVIGAVKLILNVDGQLEGHNMDHYGAIQSLKSVISSIEGKNILVLGAGGAARAAAYAYQKQGANVHIWNRTPDRAKAFAEKIGINFVEDMRSWHGKPDIVVNATALSSLGSQSTLVPFPLWERVEVAMDAVYGNTSLFLEEAKAAQVKHCIAGETWFQKECPRLFKFLTGIDPEPALVQQLTEEATALAAN